MRQKQTSDDWTLDLFGGHVELFFFLFLFFTVKEETAAARHYRPQHVSARHTHQQKREWRARQRQTDNLCTDVFSFLDWCVWDRRSMLWDVSQAPHSISTTTFSMELIDLRAGCEGGIGTLQAARHCFLHSATSHVSLHATLRMLSSAGRQAREHAGKISLWL